MTNLNDKKHIFLLGSGGHASVLVDILTENNISIAAVYAPTPPMNKTLFSDMAYREYDDEIFHYDPDDVLLINGVGMLPKNSLRKELFKKFSEKGFHFMSVVSASAKISNYASLGTGVQICHNAIIQAGAEIGDQTIVNTNAIVEHDVKVGGLNHLAPRSTLCGGVETGGDVFIGAGAVIRPYKKIADGAVIGAQTLV